MEMTAIWTILKLGTPLALFAGGLIYIYTEVLKAEEEHRKRAEMEAELKKQEEEKRERDAKIDQKEKEIKAIDSYLASTTVSIEEKKILEQEIKGKLEKVPGEVDAMGPDELRARLEAHGFKVEEWK